MGSDRIELRGLRAMGVHGVLPEEQTRPQPFCLDIDIEADLRAASTSDRLEDTVDYAAAASAAASVITDERHALLERVAERVAEEILRDERARSVRVTVRKVRPPVGVDLGGVAVCIERP